MKYDFAFWAAVDRAFDALPDLTPDQIEALPKDVRDRQAGVEQLHMTLTFVREGMPERTFEQIAIDNAAILSASVVTEARKRLASVKRFVAWERQ